MWGQGLLGALLLLVGTATIRGPACGWHTFPKAVNNTLCFGFKEVYGKDGSKLSTGDACEAACCQNPHCNYWQFGASKPPSKYDGCWEWVDPGPPSSCSTRSGWNGRSGRPVIPPPAPPPPTPVAQGPWKDPNLPIEKRLADLLPRLTEDELLSQLSNSAGPFLDQTQYEFGQECLAGFDGTGLWASSFKNVKTFPTSAFPHAVSLGMSFDRSLVRSVAAAIGYEARAGFTHFNRPSLTCQSPVLNIARDPRWGRCMEVFAEDPTTVAALGHAYVQGIQHGDVGAPSTDILLIASSPKHFADYNLDHYGTADRNTYNAVISAHDMRETYLAGFKAVAPDIQGFMCSVNEVNGIPMCAHEDLINKVMRNELGMVGAVISDGDTVFDFVGGHNYTKTPAEAAGAAINAGCDQSWDMNLPPANRMGDPNGTVAQALQQNLTTLTAIHTSAANTLRQRFRVGLYDNPNSTKHNPWEDIPASVILSDAHTALASRAAAESMTLLRADDGVLPLRPVADGGPKKIAVIGVAATSASLSIGYGHYSGNPDKAHELSFLDGIQKRAAQAGASVISCNRHALAPMPCAASLKHASLDLGTIVLVLTGMTESEGHDRTTLGIDPQSLALLQAVHAQLSTVPKILVIVSGGAVSTEEAEPLVNASVWAGKAGMQAGGGFASLLYGDMDFSGRVAATVYRKAWVNASSMLDNSISSGAQSRGYRYMSSAATAAFVQYRFGHGESLYTYSSSFQQQQYNISAASLEAGDSLNVTATITATDGTATRRLSNTTRLHSVLLFLNHTASSPDATDLPVREEWLGDFSKARDFSQTSPTVGKATVTLSLGRDVLSRWVPTGQAGVASRSFTEGSYRVMKGLYSLRLTDGAATATLTVL